MNSYGISIRSLKIDEFSGGPAFGERGTSRLLFQVFSEITDNLKFKYSRFLNRNVTALSQQLYDLPALLGLSFSRVERMIHLKVFEIALNSQLF